MILLLDADIEPPWTWRRSV